MPAEGSYKQNGEQLQKSGPPQTLVNSRKAVKTPLKRDLLQSYENDKKSTNAISCTKHKKIWKDCTHIAQIAFFPAWFRETVETEL